MITIWYKRGNTLKKIKASLSLPRTEKINIEFGVENTYDARQGGWQNGN